MFPLNSERPSRRRALHNHGHAYQLAFRTPGTSPRKLKRRKQILHMRNRLKNPRTRPQSGQRWYAWVENLVFLAALFLRANRDTLHLPPFIGPVACTSLLISLFLRALRPERHPKMLE